jgi:hypothetical protein
VLEHAEHASNEDEAAGDALASVADHVSGAYPVAR